MQIYSTASLMLRSFTLTCIVTLNIATHLLMKYVRVTSGIYAKTEILEGRHNQMKVVKKGQLLGLPVQLGTTTTEPVL